MGKIRRKFDIQFKTQVVQAIESGSHTLAGICRDHQLSRTVVERWLVKYQAGGLEARPSSRERELERQVEKLQAKVGEQVMLIDFLKKMGDWKRQQKSVDTSIITPRNLAQYQKHAKQSGSARAATTTDQE
jgi:transposase-like protein